MFIDLQWSVFYFDRVEVARFSLYAVTHEHFASHKRFCMRWVMNKKCTMIDVSSRDSETETLCLGVDWTLDHAHSQRVLCQP